MARPLEDLSISPQQTKNKRQAGKEKKVGSYIELGIPSALSLAWG
jgi:hypothetical protein